MIKLNLGNLYLSCVKYFSVAGGERKFSNLKIILYCLRSASQERLCCVAALAIENSSKPGIKVKKLNFY
jgi:hypothetical protein